MDEGGDGFLVMKVSKSKMVWVGSRLNEPTLSSDRFLGEDRLSDLRRRCGNTALG